MASLSDDLSTTQLLAAAESGVRAMEVEQLRVVLAWCDRHGEDPQALPGAVPVKHGGDRLIAVGGEGTPEVAELCFGELAIALEKGVIATRNLAGDVLDLRHRLPLTWARVVAGECEPWAALKAAKLSRPLDRDRVGLVDHAVAAAVGEGPQRMLTVAEAKVIEADPDAHRARIAAEDAKTGVWLSRTKAGDTVDVFDAQPGTRRINARLPIGTAVEIDAVLDDLADALAEHVEPADGEEKPSRRELRAQAFELLSRPHDAVAFLDGLDPAEHADRDEPAGEVKPRGRRRSGVLHVHLSALALHALGAGHGGGVGGVARVEGLGPLLLEQLTALLRHREIRLQPVIDLNTIETVTAYEHPTVMRQRVLLRHAAGDGFPHSTSAAGLSGRVDLDHATPYDSSGPPGQPAQTSGQTSDLNTTPLTRTHHRTKTHTGYQVHPLGLAAHRWVTPHGLARVVTPHGTTRVELIRARDGTIHGELYPQPAHQRLDLCLVS
ncbi:hypothetical protein [Nocardioides sambongensis]|uniref:hypothetical protein n=1 Tax=Nocardioides sambongensis TaxID=2589074 RepID=UPI0011266DC5|nr:hypothetical protein [Nocardioides sambongensis]